MKKKENKLITITSDIAIITENIKIWYIKGQYILFYGKFLFQ